MFKKLVVAGVVALASMSSFAADYGSAATLVGAAGYAFADTALPTDGSDFGDNFTFKLASGSGTQVQFEANFINLSVQQGDPSYGVMSMPLVSFTLNNVTKASQSVVLGSSVTGTTVTSAGFSGLIAGNVYTLHVTGTGLASQGNAGSGSYYLGDKYAVSIAAVPEPESYAMFMSGIGLLGFMARRRSAKV